MRTAAYIVGGILASCMILLAVALVCLSAAQIADDAWGGEQKPPVVHADFMHCFRIKPPPLRPQKRVNGAAPIADLT
jgi:hypothetical protein